MAERGPRPALDISSSGTSPVPAEYGSLGGGIPKTRTPPPDRATREKRPSRWRTTADDEVGDGAGTEGGEADEAGADEAEGGEAAPVARESSPGPSPTRRPGTPGAARARRTAADAAPDVTSWPSAPAEEAAPPRRRSSSDRAPTEARSAAPRTRRPASTGEAPAARTPAVRRRGDEDDDSEPAPRPARPALKERVEQLTPAVPRRRVDASGRLRRVRDDETDPEPEARPVAYLDNTIRARQVVRHVELWTVLRMSLLFYGVAAVVGVLAGIVLWNVASALGTLDSINRSVRTLFDLKTFALHPLPVLGYGLVTAVVLIILGTVVNLLAGLFFNLLAELVGGVGVYVVAEPDNT